MKPVDDADLHFISGSVTEENLKRANVQDATTVVILGDDALEANARDAKVVLSTLTVETFNPEAYTIVELVNKENVQHCERARADEVIVGSRVQQLPDCKRHSRSRHYQGPLRGPILPLGQCSHEGPTSRSVGWSRISRGHFGDEAA